MVILKISGKYLNLIFEHDTEGKVDNANSFYLSDRNYITDENLTLYGKDYYLYNFVGTSALTRALHTTVSGSPFIDEGANKTISFSVNKKIGDSKIVITLPAGIRYTNDGVQKISLKVYKTRSIDESRYQVDDFLTEIVPADYTVDNSTNPMTITIHAPSSYFANGINTSGVIEFESWYDWDYVMNDYNTLFPRSKVEEILEEFYNSYDHSERVSELLTDRPYLMRTFLENFGYQNYEQEIEYNGLDAYVYVGLPDTVDLTVEKKYDITINNKHVPNNKVEIVNKDVTEIFKIEGRYFVKGSNNVSIQIIDEIPVEYQTFSPEDILEDDGLRILTVSGFENLGNFENNIIVLEKIDSTDPEATQFATSAKVGYKVFENYTFGPYDEDTGTISLIFDRIPDHEFLVYNKNFSTSYAYVKPSISTVTDVIIPVYLGTENNPIPFIPRGKIYVYCGNDKFIEGIDYFVKTPEDDPSIAGSFIIMKRVVLPGSQVDIYFSNHKTTTVYNKTGYFRNNRYGLFYLGNLNFPFSMKYLNFYINGQKLGEDDIDILSDKLIRVHSMPVPMYDLVVESIFTVDDSELAPYIAEYQTDKFEDYLARLFQGANYAGSMDVDSNYNINEVYESFIDTVDSVNKRPNPSSREAEWISSYSVPIKDKDDNTIGVISTDISLKRLSMTISEEVPYDHSYFMMLGQEGHYFVHTDTTKLAKKTIFDDLDPLTQADIIALGHEMIAGNNGYMEVVVDGETCLVFYKPLENTSWSIALICWESDIFRSYNNLLYVIAPLLFIGLLLLVYFLHRIVNYFVHTLNRLASQTRHIADGNFNVPMPTTTRVDAIGRLQNNFSAMQQSLARYISQLERVNEETEQRNAELACATQQAEEAALRQVSFLQDLLHQIHGLPGQAAFRQCGCQISHCFLYPCLSFVFGLTRWHGYGLFRCIYECSSTISTLFPSARSLAASWCAFSRSCAR